MKMVRYSQGILFLMILSSKIWRNLRFTLHIAGSVGAVICLPSGATKCRKARGMWKDTAGWIKTEGLSVVNLRDPWAGS